MKSMTYTLDCFTINNTPFPMNIIYLKILMAYLIPFIFLIVYFGSWKIYIML